MLVIFYTITIQANVLALFKVQNIHDFSLDLLMHQSKVDIW